MMTTLPPREPRDLERDPAAAPASDTPRAVHRAIGELRRGAPVLFGGAHPLVVIAAETASAEGLADAAAVAGEASPGLGEAILLLTEARLAVLQDGVPGPGENGGRLLALPVAASLAAVPRSILGTGRPPPSAPFAFPRPPHRQLVDVPPGGAAALAALKLARLMPVALAAAAAPGAAARALARDVLAIEAGAVASHAMRQALALAIVAEAPVPLLDAPDARLLAFRAPDAGIEHVAIVIGDPASRPAPLVRIHSECFTGDLLGSLRCDCGDQLRGAIRQVAEEGAGIVLYLAQEGRGIGLVNKLRAYALQDDGLDTLDANRALGWDADERSFLLAATMLELLGVGRCRLLTNNPDKIAALAAFGIEVAARVPIAIASNPVNEAYLRTKRVRFGHLPG